MNQQELDILRNLGYPFDCIALDRPSITLARVEARISFPADLVTLYVACRFLPGWPDGDAIVSCVEALKIALGVEVSLFARCTIHTAAHVAHEATDSMLYAEQDTLPEDDRQGRSNAATRVHAVCCKLIREILQPPEAVAALPKVEPVLERLSPDGLTGELLPAREKDRLSASAPLEWPVPPRAVCNSLLCLAYLREEHRWGIHQFESMLHCQDASETTYTAWAHMVEVLFVSGIFCAEDDGRLLVDWDTFWLELNNRLDREQDDGPPLEAIQPREWKRTHVVLLDYRYSKRG
jgi:hypothetical protein